MPLILMTDVGEPPFPPPQRNTRSGNLFNELPRSISTVQRTQYLHLQGVQRRVTSQVAHAAGLVEIAVAAEDLHRLVEKLRVSLYGPNQSTSVGVSQHRGLTVRPEVAMNCTASSTSPSESKAPTKCSEHLSEKWLL